MVRMSVYYPNNPGCRFDHAYYAGPHRRLVEKHLTSHGLREVQIERGVAGYAGSPAPYIAVGHLLFESLSALEAAWSAKGAAIVADVANYTDAQPVIQISEIVPV